MVKTDMEKLSDFLARGFKECGPWSLPVSPEEGKSLSALHHQLNSAQADQKQLNDGFALVCRLVASAVAAGHLPAISELSPSVDNLWHGSAALMPGSGYLAAFGIPASGVFMQFRLDEGCKIISGAAGSLADATSNGFSQVIAGDTTGLKFSDGRKMQTGVLETFRNRTDSLVFSLARWLDINEKPLAWAEIQKPATPVSSLPRPELKCGKCGFMFAETAKFCIKCGAPVTTAQKKTDECSGCGTGFKPGQKFCRSCGQKLSQE